MTKTAHDPRECAPCASIANAPAQRRWDEWANYVGLRDGNNG